jgi:hypothetical protein
MSLILKTATLDNLEAINHLEKTIQKQNSTKSEMDLEIESWNSPWRSESLEHYLKLGWSFLALKNEIICGYFIAQPLLFFENQTQSLWVEHLFAEDKNSYIELIELCVKLSKEKHFQRVYLPTYQDILQNLKIYKIEEYNKNRVFIKTTKA